MRLVYTDTGVEVKIGDTVHDDDPFEFAKVIGIRKPHKPGSTGRVQLRSSDDCVGEYFPSVINAHWIEREDQAAAEAAGDVCDVVHRPSEVSEHGNKP